ncbi:DUF4365 domain-containing protein [Priestia aryabhattai]|uniref:DUF4365 domain-containing protein n=1 Tax=Priestia aryabhattai TaxID=412384 RepID=UPI000C06CBFC|nr:DUF4365 domain-containing protein [Priestia aryabhattai]
MDHLILQISINKEEVTPIYTDNQRKGNAGVADIGKEFRDTFGWLFTEIPNQNDMGIDGYVEIINQNSAIGKSFVVQVKKGTSWLNESDEDNFYYKFDEKKKNYWSKHVLPVILTFVNDNDGNKYWVHFQKENVYKKGNDTFHIKVPKCNLLTPTIARAHLTVLALNPDPISQRVMLLERNLELYELLAKYPSGKFTKGKRFERVDELATLEIDLIDQMGEVKEVYTVFTNYNEEQDQKEHLLKALPGADISETAPKDIKESVIVPYEENSDDDLLEEQINHEFSDMDQESSSISENENIQDKKEDVDVNEYWHKNIDEDDLYLTLSSLGKSYLISRDYLLKIN